MAVVPVPVSGLAGRRRYSCKAARHVKRFALLQNVEAGPRQLVRQRLDCHHVIRPRFLALVEPFRLGAVAQREVGRLDKGPGQILVAVFGVPFPLLLAVAGAHAVDAARIGSKVAWSRETINRPCFQQDRGRQHPTDPGHAGEQFVLRSLCDFFLQDAFQEGRSAWKAWR